MSERLQAYAKELLLSQMEDISEDYYCAGWLADLEHYLWSVVCGKKCELFDLPADRVAKLKQLAEDANGWWIWDNGRKFVPMAEWLEMVKTTQQ